MQEPTIKSPLLNKSVYIYPIIRSGSWLQDIHKHHDGAFMFTGTKTVIMGVPFSNSQDRSIDPLTEEEKLYFYSDFSKLRIKEGTLSVFSPECYWNTFKVKLSKEPFKLNLSDDLDYLKWAFLKAQTDLIAPTWESRYDKGHYKYAIRDIGEEENQKAINVNKKFVVYDHIGKIRENYGKLLNVLKLYNLSKNIIKKYTNATHNALVVELDNISSQDIEGLYKIFEDPKFELKLFIYSAIDCGAIKRLDAYEYSIIDVDTPMLMRDIVEFLEAAKNQLVKAKITTKIEEYEKK